MFSVTQLQTLGKKSLFPHWKKLIPHWLDSKVRLSDWRAADRSQLTLKCFMLWSLQFLQSFMSKILNWCQRDFRSEHHTVTFYSVPLSSLSDPTHISTRNVNPDSLLNSKHLSLINLRVFAMVIMFTVLPAGLHRRTGGAPPQTDGFKGA